MVVHNFLQDELKIRFHEACMGESHLPRKEKNEQKHYNESCLHGVLEIVVSQDNEVAVVSVVLGVVVV